jgi:hypothetical protein
LYIFNCGLNFGHAAQIARRRRYSARSASFSPERIHRFIDRAKWPACSARGGYAGGPGGPRSAVLVRRTMSPV